MSSQKVQGIVESSKQESIKAKEELDAKMKAAQGARENAISTIQAKAKAVLDKVEHVEKTLASVADERRKSIDAKLQKAELGEENIHRYIPMIHPNST